MSKDRTPWRDGRRAWERLTGWDREGPTPGHPDDGDAALTALADVGQLRHLLDQAELVAVRTARRHRKSWAEIATKLGVTRQSAWEKWRDLDEAAGPPASVGEVPLEVVPEIDAATVEMVRLAELGAAKYRRRSSTVVPNVIGRSWDEAQTMLRGKGLVAAGSDPDAAPVAWSGGVVTDQSPESGARVPPGSAVRLWMSRGDGDAGVREPRRPNPSPKSVRAMRDEPSGEAVG